jgi:hypothetical protein
MLNGFRFFFPFRSYQSMNFKKFQEAVQITVIDDRGGGQSGAQ